MENETQDIVRTAIYEAAEHMIQIYPDQTSSDLRWLGRTQELLDETMQHIEEHYMFVTDETIHDIFEKEEKDILCKLLEYEEMRKQRQAKRALRSLRKYFDLKWASKVEEGVSKV